MAKALYINPGDVEEMEFFFTPLTGHKVCTHHFFSCTPPHSPFHDEFSFRGCL